MKSLLLNFLFALVCSLTMVEEINNDDTNTWRAVEYPESVISLEKMRSMLMKPVPEAIIEPEVAATAALPTEFSALDEWGDIVLPVRDQAQCGSCWAFAVAETAGVRLGIVNGKKNAVLSPQDLVSCDTRDEACDGGYPDYSWNYAVGKGIATDACIPYTSGAGKVAKCPSTCTNGSAITRVKAKSAAAVKSANMQTELYTYGPFEVAFNVYTDFETYASGVYKHKTGKLEGGHAVLLVGWGTENNTPYWLVQNSWGTEWGLKGFFKIVRGGNECGIEGSAWAGKY